MSRAEVQLAGRARELRAAFDRSFAAAPAGRATAGEAFLAIRVADDNYALRLTEISGLHVDKKVVPLPSACAELLGIASFRGALVPVYDLRVLLAYPAASVPRWMVLLAAERPLGIAFDGFDGYLDVPREDVAAERHADAAHPYANEIVRAGDAVRAVVHLPAVFEALSNRASHDPHQ